MKASTVRAQSGICAGAPPSPIAPPSLLHKLLRKTKSVSCLELGTCLGISASYQAAALELNGAGRLITMEGAAPVAALAQQTVDKLGHGRVTIEVGRFQDTLDGVLAANKPFDYAFIDGHHDGPATVDYYNRILPGPDRRRGGDL